MQVACLVFNSLAFVPVYEQVRVVDLWRARRAWEWQVDKDASDITSVSLPPCFLTKVLQPRICWNPLQYGIEAIGLQTYLYLLDLRRDTSKRPTLTSSASASTCMQGETFGKLLRYKLLQPPCTPDRVRSRQWMSWRWSWEAWACPPPSLSWSPTCGTRGARSASQTSSRSCTVTARRRVFQGSYWKPSEGWTLKERGIFQQR